jgi:hypothetical protein
MKSYVRRVLAASVALGCAGLAPAALAVPEIINNCKTITLPGSYVLKDNLAAAGDCLVVQADFVTIDLEGFVISGNGTGSGITDQNVTRRGITVRNGTLTGFSNGVDLRASRGVTVEQVRTIANGNNGVTAGQLATVRGVLSFDNTGIGILAGLGSTIIGNTLGRNQAGISSGIGSSVINNTSRNNVSTGISVECPSLVLGNAATANAIDLQLIGGGACTSDHNATGQDPG